MFKSLNTTAITNLSANLELGVGLWKGIWLSWRGTNQSGQTLSLANCGSLRMLKDGVEKHNISISNLYNVTQLLFGAGESASSAGGAFTHSVFLPFALPDHQDVAYIVRPGDLVQLLVSFPAATGTVVASGTFTALGVRAKGNEFTPYELNWRDVGVTTGSGNSDHQLNVENVSSLYVQNSSDLLTIGVEADGERLTDTLAKAEYIAASQVFNRDESFSASEAFFEIDLNPSKQVSGATNTKLRVSTTNTSGGALALVALSMFPTPTKLSASIARRQQYITNRIAEKAATSQTAAVAALRTAIEG